MNSRRGFHVGLCFGFAFVGIIWAAVAGAAVALPQTPTWAIWTPAALALASVAGSSAAAVAALTAPRGPHDGGPPPGWTAAAYRHGTSWHATGPGRPSAERPTPPVEQWDCPVTPGYPRTVADLRRFDRRPRRRDLSAWE